MNETSRNVCHYEIHRSLAKDDIFDGSRYGQIPYYILWPDFNSKFNIHYFIQRLYKWRELYRIRYILPNSVFIRFREFRFKRFHLEEGDWVYRSGNIFDHCKCAIIESSDCYSV